ncbi:MAG: hypothetical protein HYS27_09115 [Deltaproteobacteria bacterium]|nr:hypothetical protein [Deltaproteobacteria bacterium]
MALQSLRTPELAAWAAYLILTPIYIWQSGRPQPADIWSVVLAPLLLRGRKPAFPPHLRSALGAVLAFAVYAALVNVAWGVLLLDYAVRKVGAIGFASFYLFNAYIFFVCAALFVVHRQRFLVVTVWGTAASVWIQVIVYALKGAPGGFRESLMFNNANQLGYYALLTATLVALGYRHGKLPVVLAGLAVAASAFLAALSLSKAAMIGAVCTACIAAIRRPMLLIVVILSALAGASIKDPAALLMRIEMRMNDMGSSYDDTPQGRGYSRITENPQYLVFGAAEVGHDRHNRDIAGELHSSVGTLVFSYGVVGAALFCVFLWRALRCTPWSDLLFFLPIFLYGLTHQGLRFRLFWITVAVACMLGVEAQQAGARRRRVPAIDSLGVR